MENPRTLTCTICGEDNKGERDWFLVVEDSWLDRLKILGWNQSLAGKQGVHCLCNAAHVRELVAHWMATGSLEYPCAELSTTRKKVTIHESGPRTEEKTPAEIPDARFVAELAVHRESLQRALRENPESLAAVLEALRGALHQEITNNEPVTASREELALV